MQGRSNKIKWDKAQGFTLVEVMIAVAIVAIITAIALPSYKEYVIKTGRTDGKISLLSAAQAMERCFTATSTYVGCAIPATSGKGKYTLAFPAAATVSNFTITATPTVGTNQASDLKCTTLSVDQAGLRSATGANIAVCW